ncbi:MAG: heparan-alpha-glucosaminide N-acetyltransferase domain-containing protein [Polaribacter sp.]|nr:heparan-alpha-glucosaminide N-acetyltransferase domain-containing protein [Polaribacter sp.]
MNSRVASVDVLRGLTIVAMILVNTPGTWSHVYAPLLHANWHGYTPTDLIFPFFLFIVGTSIAFAYKHKTPNVKTYKKIGIRSLKLIGLGLFLNVFLPYFPFIKELSTVRIPGVLQRIGVVFFVTAILSIHFNWKILLSIICVLLLGYWIWLGFVPLPNGSLPTFDRAPNNWANYIDVSFLKNHTWKSDYDPEGLLSTLPSIASGLIGVLIGRMILFQNYMKSFFLLVTGVVLLGLGLLWNVWFPINKAIWSSSFVLVTAGWGTVFLSMLYYIIDVKKKSVGMIFNYIGSNAIVIYFASSFISKVFYLTKIGETTIHGWLYATFFTSTISSDKLASLCYALSVVSFYAIVGAVLYKKKIFIKV